ncbi:hypothetical protein ABDK56_11375 [Sphingomonas sp. ASV193]|uniref:hypothetical protein n=1 Tax=Sphingomonas sp. ASV193 TaxID=3144405 RepID=UPI0032E91F84
MSEGDDQIAGRSMIGLYAQFLFETGRLLPLVLGLVMILFVALFIIIARHADQEANRHRVEIVRIRTQARKGDIADCLHRRLAFSVSKDNYQPPFSVARSLRTVMTEDGAGMRTVTLIGRDDRMPSDDLLRTFGQCVADPFEPTPPSR